MLRLIVPQLLAYRNFLIKDVQVLANELRKT